MFYVPDYPSLAQQNATKIPLPTDRKVVMGAWVPGQFHLEQMQGDRQLNAMRTLVKQGFHEYYFVMRSFSNSYNTKETEELLKSADKTDLKIIIILLPPSEGGYNGNYDWKGWVSYFNSLKARHLTSFQGFAIDDFNAIHKIRRHYYRNNVEYFMLSNLSSALDNKSKDIQFYPVIYLETGATDLVKKQYNNFVSGIILASTLYYNVTYLEDDLKAYSKIFENKPVKYILYVTKNRINSNLPSDRLIMATLSIATRVADGIIVYINTNHNIVQDYLHSRDSPQYMSAIGQMERLQLRYEILTLRRDIIICPSCINGS